MCTHDFQLPTDHTDQDSAMFSGVGNGLSMNWYTNVGQTEKVKLVRESVLWAQSTAKYYIRAGEGEEREGL